jgi:hypothetical protein
MSRGAAGARTGERAQASETSAVDEGTEEGRGADVDATTDTGEADVGVTSVLASTALLAVEEADDDDGASVAAHTIAGSAVTVCVGVAACT